MHRSRIALLALGTLAIFGTACFGKRRAAPAVGPLVGSWEQSGAVAGAAGGDTASRQHFVFRADSTALWIVNTAARRDTFAVQYRLNATTSPAWLDLFGFGAGPLQGRTLYCIADLAVRDEFRLDCEPGRTGSTGARPASFTNQTLTLRRRR